MSCTAPLTLARIDQNQHTNLPQPLQLKRVQSWVGKKRTGSFETFDCATSRQQRLARSRSESALCVGNAVLSGLTKPVVKNTICYNDSKMGNKIVLKPGALAARGFWGTGPPKSGVYRNVLDPRVFRPSGVFDADPNPATDFRRYFERGDIPIVMKHGTQLSIEWKVEPEKLDYMHYLPILFDGLLEKEDPYAPAALKCIDDMLSKGRHQILPVIPRLIIPIKRCLNTKDPDTVAKTLNVIQKLVLSDDKVGEALVPYYRQLLPVFNLYKAHNLNIGDRIEYSQRKRHNLGDLIESTLQLFECHGGEDAFVNIKYMIPTYESVTY